MSDFVGKIFESNVFSDIFIIFKNWNLYYLLINIRIFYFYVIKYELNKSANKINNRYELDSHMKCTVNKPKEK